MKSPAPATRTLSSGIRGSLALLSLMFLSAPTVHAQEQAPADGQMSVQVIVGRDHYPLIYRGANGGYEGFALDLIHAMARQMDMKVEVVQTVSEERDLGPGPNSLYPAFAFTSLREQFYDQSASYLTLTGGAFIRRDTSGVQQWEDLDGRKVLAVGQHTVGGNFVHTKLPHATLVPGRSGEEIFRRLEAGEADGAVMSRLTGLALIDRIKSKDIIPVGGPIPGYEVAICMAVDDGNSVLLTRINEGLAILNRTGEYRVIYDKWFGRLEPHRFSREEVVSYVAAALLLALAIAIWAYVRQQKLLRQIRHQAAELEENRGILNEAQALSHLGHWFRPLDGGAPHWSPEIYRIFERDPAIGPPSRGELIRLVVPTDQPRLREAVTRVENGGKAEQLEVELGLPSGNSKWIHVRARPATDVSGRLTGVFGTVLDVTELHRARTSLEDSQELLGALFENLPQAIGVVERRNREWAVLSLNPPACRNLGIESAPALGALVTEVASSPEIAKFWCDLFDKGLRSSEMLVTEARSPVSQQEFEITVVPLPGTMGLRRCCFLAEDVTESRRHEKEIAHGRRLRALGELVGGIAHEFNNLLTPILFNSDDLARQWKDSPELSSGLQTIVSAARRAAEITTRLLAFGRRSDVKSEVLDVGSIIAANVTLLRQTMDRRIHVTTDVPVDLPRTFLSSLDVHQVLLNLLLNARDTLAERLALPMTTSEWQPQISIIAGEVNVVPDNEEGLAERWIEIAVSDTGMGMKPEVQERLFEPFFTTKETGRGTGLGMATVWHIVNSFGGKIHVNSREGVGTTFDLRLPVVEPPKPSAEVKPSVSAAPGGSSGPRTVLLVEDEPTISRLVMRLLSRGGHHVVHYADGRHALKAFKDSTTAFDLVFLDVNLPGLIGTDLAAEIRVHGYAGPLLIMSGRVTKEVREIGVKVGAAAVIEKPFDLEKLTEVLASLGIDVSRGRGPARQESSEC